MSVYKRTFDIQVHFQYFWCTLCISLLSIKKNGPLRHFVPACLDPSKTKEINYITSVLMPNQQLKRKWNQDSHYYNQILKILPWKKNKNKRLNWVTVGGWWTDAYTFFLPCDCTWCHPISCQSSLLQTELQRPAEEEAVLPPPLSSPRLASWRWFYGTDRRWGLAGCFPGSFASLASPSTSFTLFIPGLRQQ